MDYCYDFCLSLKLYVKPIRSFYLWLIRFAVVETYAGRPREVGSLQVVSEP